MVNICCNSDLLENCYTLDNDESLDFLQSPIAKKDVARLKLGKQTMAKSIVCELLYGYVGQNYLTFWSLASSLDVVYAILGTNWFFYFLLSFPWWHKPSIVKAVPIKKNTWFPWFVMY